MSITKAQWATPDKQTVNVSYDGAAAIAVPAVEDNRHYSEVLRWVARGNKIDDFVEPTEVDHISDLSAAKETLYAAIRYAAHDILSPTDWVVVRKAETGVDASPEITAFREAVRASSEQKIVEVSATASVDALKAYLRSDAYKVWPTA